MAELPGKIRVQDATLANMVSLAAILEYLEQRDPGAKLAIEQRAQEIARSIQGELTRSDSDDDAGDSAPEEF